MNAIVKYLLTISRYIGDGRTKLEDIYNSRQSVTASYRKSIHNTHDRKDKQDGVNYTGLIASLLLALVKSDLEACELRALS